MAASKSASEYQKKDDAAHATAIFHIRRRMKGSRKRRYRKVFGVVVKRTVIAMMKNYLDNSGELRVEVMELELLMGPVDSEVNLMYIMTQSSRRSSSMFEMFSSSGSSGHIVASRHRWVTYQKKKVEQRERLQWSATKDCDRGDPCWTGECESLPRRMLEYLEDSESTKVSTQRGVGGTTLVSKRTRDQCRAHRKASQEREERKVISNLQAKRR